MHSLRRIFASFVIAPVLLSFLGVLAANGAESTFYPDVQTWSAKHQDVFEQANALALAGETRRGNRLLLSCVETDGSPLAAFAIANMLYTSDPATSYMLHQKALNAFPREPGVALEMAMEQHRRGEYEVAISNYQKYLSTGEGARYACLLADCFLRTGKLEEAVAAWKSANHPNNHTGIDFAIHEVYGSLSPVQRRGDLIEKVKAGDRGKLPELIDLDLHFDRDWWNSSVFEEALDRDLKLAATQMGSADARYKDLALYTKLAGQEEPNAQEIREALTAARLVIGPGARLPESSRLTRRLIELAITSKAESPGRLWELHQANLKARVEKHDSDALHALCLLAIDSENGQLESLVETGWKQWHDPEFAVSYVLEHARHKKLTIDDLELTAALTALPESNYLNQLRLSLAGESGVPQEFLVAAIKAEYRKLSSGMIIPDSYTLKGLFYQLEQKL